MSITLTSTTTAVTLTESRIDFSTQRNIINYVFTDGTDEQLDVGKGSDSITISGIETTTPKSKMHQLQVIMDNQEFVTLSGMVDTNLNTDYLIDDLNFDQQGGQEDRYNWSITLERKFD